ncbi:hypothetical protein G6F65_022856 [Rhizopus arrhizus]|nr:hypothetical protein G6F65_022856 [Rhizopus arrhizus]
MARLGAHPGLGDPGGAGRAGGDARHPCARAAVRYRAGRGGGAVLRGAAVRARFVPMRFSKRLVVFTHRGRPVILQGGTRELRSAFVKIAQVYRRG